MKSYRELFDGTLWGVMQWQHWDEMRERILNAGEWYVYALGHDMPDHTISGDKLKLALDEMDVLLRKDHKEKYLGIVYADDLMSPSLIKVYDPNNLGSSCGSSGRKILPGWVLSKMPPEPMVNPYPVPQNRIRWWQEIKDRLAAHH